MDVSPREGMVKRIRAVPELRPVVVLEGGRLVEIFDVGTDWELWVDGILRETAEPTEDGLDQLRAQAERLVDQEDA